MLTSNSSIGYFVMFYCWCCDLGLGVGLWLLPCRQVLLLSSLFWGAFLGRGCYCCGALYICAAGQALICPRSPMSSIETISLVQLKLIKITEHLRSLLVVQHVSRKHKLEICLTLLCRAVQISLLISGAFIRIN